MIAFLDASALIYLLEGERALARRCRTALADLVRGHPGASVSMSRLSWLECRIGPLKSGDADSLARFDAFFDQPDLRWVELSSDVVELATAIRVRHGLRTPDALQAACCLQWGDAHRLLTGDAAFRRVAGLHVLLLR